MAKGRTKSTVFTYSMSPEGGVYIRAQKNDKSHHTPPPPPLLPTSPVPVGGKAVVTNHD